MFKENKIQNLMLLMTLFGLILYGCIEEFTPELKNAADIIVIDGSLIKGQEQQEINVSWSTNLEVTEFRPISNCMVKIINPNGQEFLFSENKPGIYVSDINNESLVYNSAYKLYIKTPDGEEFESELDTLYEGSPVDSLYYEVESFQTSAESYDKGLQFYADLKAGAHKSKYYRWIVEETYEVNTFYEIDAYYVRKIDSIINRPISDSINVCWETNQINQIFTSSLETLTGREKKKIPLNFVPGIDRRINIKYSILVQQFPLTKKTYTYWDNHRITSTESGGLYHHQPPQSITNIYSLSNPDRKVLGYFWTSSFNEKRIFFDGPLITFSHCELFECVECPLKLLLWGMNIDTVYLTALEYWSERPELIKQYGILFDQICINCTAKGGYLEKPDFWE